MSTFATTQPYISLCGGGWFDFLTPEKSDFEIEDIAHALANLCRFTGHTRQFYSVAQHCVLASDIVPPDDARAALCHDAAEAFLGDVSRPLKTLLPDYKRLEKSVEAEVFLRLGVALPLPESVHVADLVMLATERRDLMPDDGVAWGVLQHVTPLQSPIEPWSSVEAESRFLRRWAELTGERISGLTPRRVGRSDA